jgi:predicted peptidase
MLNRREFCLTVGAAMLLPKQIVSAQTEEVFDAKIFQNAKKQSLPYRLFVPQAVDKRRLYPLVLWLHGGAGRGNDNAKQIAGGNILGAHVWTTPENQAKNPCFVVAPQCPENETWATFDEAKPAAALQLVMELLADLRRTLQIDPHLLYVAGQSLGGFGTWSIISAHPEMFAAASPLCGGGDESQASRLTKTSIWAFHGEKDQTVSVERSRKMISAIRQAGGNPKYTEYKDTGHQVWEKAFREPELLPWAFAQKRSGQ